MTRLLRDATPPGVVATGFVLAVALVPFALSDFRASQFAYVAIYFIAILGLNIVTGYTGQISLGHGAFMAVGGYTTAILANKADVDYLWTIPIAGILAGAAGFLVGVPALRLTGLYLALATFGIAVATPALLKKFPGFTGGSSGLSFDLVRAPWGVGLSPNDWLYALTWSIALIMFAIAWLLLRGKLGRTFRAVRDSEVAATSFGVNLAVYKTLAFGISAFYAGVAGALFAVANLSFVSPETFPIRLSIFLVAGAVAAGLGSLTGIVFGAALIEFLPIYSPDIARAVNWLLHTDFDPKSAGVPSVIFGAVLILVMVALPNGAAGLLRAVVRPLTGRYTRGPYRLGADFPPARSTDR